MNKTKIVIVDNEVSFTKMVRLNLEQTGNYDVLEENISTRAVEAIRNFMPDLILLDLVMPDMGGEVVAQNILDDPELKHIKIIFLTALVSEHELSMLEKKKEGELTTTIGKRVFIAKPVAGEELIACIEEQLQQ